MYHKNILQFQSPLRRTERPTVAVIPTSTYKISIHAPTNGATPLYTRQRGECRFQSTLRRTERLSCRCVDRYALVFQSTLRRTERLTSKYSFQPYTDISIHAPTNGATYTTPLSQPAWQISIHAPTNGATSGMRTSKRLLPNFNPRSDERSDECLRKSLSKECTFQSTLRRTERR